MKIFAVFIQLALSFALVFAQDTKLFIGYRYGQLDPPQEVTDYLLGVPVNAELTIVGVSNSPTVGLLRATRVADAAVASGIKSVRTSFLVSNIRGVYISLSHVREQSEGIHSIQSQLDGFGNELGKLKEELSGISRVGRVDTVVITDTSFSGSVYFSIGGTGVVNVFTREPLYGGGASTQIRFPAFNGYMLLGASFDGATITTLNTTYNWYITNTLGAELFASAGGFYSTFPQPDGPARKWIGIPFGIMVSYPIGSGYISATFDLMPHGEILQYPNSARFRTLAGLGLSVYGGVRIEVPISSK